MIVDIPRVDPQIALHRLFVFEGAKPVSQNRKKLGEERRLATKVEVEKLLKVKFIKEAKYTTWLANVVLVKKASGK